MDYPPKVRAATRSGRFDLQAEATRLGRDWLVCIWGGESPHIGAVAMAAPRPSLADPALTSATASVFAYLGHKEDDLAKSAAEALCSALNAKVVVTAGMHWDDISAQGIQQVKANALALIEELQGKMKD
ncbi:hypothetical protein AAU61_13370 [Desulfocarbo indianensis]|nr:hypothetical protein AAU61_13370 [Desulfocarbo indianensis]